jgi:hypothetical protein
MALLEEHPQSGTMEIFIQDPDLSSDPLSIWLEGKMVHFQNQLIP